MRPREIFGIGIRLLGLWFWTQAAYWAFWAILKSSQTGLGNPNIPAREDLASTLFNLLMGLCLFAGAKALIWLAYGDDIKPSALSRPDSENTDGAA